MTAANAPAALIALPEDGAVAGYRHLDAAERYIHQTRDRAWLEVLRRHGYRDLSTLRILELGCGEGSLLRSLLHYGADPRQLEGIDIDGARIERARAALPDVRLALGDGASLPYSDQTFDLAFAFTFFTSVLDPQARRRSAAEALRVLRPDGLLLVYDFWLNPLNPRVRPLRAGELRELFAPRSVRVERVTLAPPIVRALRGRRSLCRPLERLPFLRTHLLAAVAKEG